MSLDGEMMLTPLCGGNKLAAEEERLYPAPAGAPVVGAARPCRAAIGELERFWRSGRILLLLTFSRHSSQGRRTCLDSHESRGP